jgi:hypothetical protein
LALLIGSAKQQVKEFLDLMRGLGSLELAQVFNAQDFRYDFRLRSK